MASAEDEYRAKCDASQIYLLSGKNYRISRSIKVQWFLENFNCTVKPKADNVINSSSEELEVLSVLCKGSADCSNLFTVVPSTLITFLGRIYKFVFCLDVSQSLANVDILSGKVVSEISFESFKNCVRGLVLPFSAPRSTLILSPELHVTVLGYSGVTDCGTVQVLVEGCLVTQDNVESFLSSVYDKLRHMENKTASVVQASIHQQSNDGRRPLSNEMSIVAMLKMSLLALELLPGTASGGIVIISDGVFGLPSAAVVHALLAQLRSHTVCCSFVKVGSPFQAQCSFGHIPNTDLMQFLAVATSGAYLREAPPIEELTKKTENTTGEDLPPMNFYHKAFLCWSFQREYDLSKISSWEDNPHIMESVTERSSSGPENIPIRQWRKALTEPLIRKRHLERNLKTTISSVLSVRLREGYCVDNITFLRGGKELVVKLMLLWKQNVHIEYTATAAWPVSASNPQTRIEVFVVGTYEFLHDVYSKQLFSMKGYRLNVVETFNHASKNLEMTDALLVSLQSFSSNRLYYTIPESAKKGVPLFYLPPNSPHPVLSLEQGKSRQKWMHCHRINMVLEHDRPLPKSLFLPSTNDRSYHIQCRMALSSLAALLKRWSSFVLLESHSYIKFVDGDDSENPPRSFCILRLSSKAPCVVIRLAFLGGMPGAERHQIVNSLRDEIKVITAQFAAPGNLSKQSQKESVNQVRRQIHEQLVCTKLLHKPVDRILVRYEEQPREFLVRPYHSENFPGITETFEPWMHRMKGATESPLKVLSRYLYHQRWVFTLRNPGNCSLSSADTVSKILRCLTRLRQDQSFKFIASNLGVTTMFKEFWVKETSDASEPQTTCVVQYVMFSPLISSTNNRVVGWALDSRLPEDDRDLQLVVEVWVEPQEGVIVEDEKPNYLVGKRYYDIPAKIFEADLEHISAWLTYDHLRHMCDDRVVSAPGQAVVDITPPPNDPEKKSLIYEVPFSFDVMKVLSRSKQAELLFSTLIDSDRPVSSKFSCRRSNDILFEHLLEHMGRLHDRELTLTADDSLRFSSFIRNGLEKTEHAENVSWRCFTRAENGHLLLTFFPSSYQSLIAFARALEDLQLETVSFSESADTCSSGKFVSSRKRQSSKFKRTRETSSADELDGDTSQESFGKFWSSGRSIRESTNLSFFVYDFAASSLFENRIPNEREIVDTVLLDHRNKLDQFNQDASLEKSKELRSHCMGIYELFCWCFVATVFDSLRRGEYVDDDNLEEVLGICGDHIAEEIDITEFLGNICGHIKHSPTSKSQSCHVCDVDEPPEIHKREYEESALSYIRTSYDGSVSSPVLGRNCEELTGLHYFIQRRFAKFLGKYFAPIPNKKAHYFYRPFFREDSIQSSTEETADESVDSSSDAASDVVFESGEDPSVDEKNVNNDRNDIDDGALDNRDGWERLDGDKPDYDLESAEDKYSDYPSDRSDIQSSIKHHNMMDELHDLEQEYNVPLFLNLSCTIRDRSHLSSAMVSMPADYLPACLADILDQVMRDPNQFIDPSISSLLITLDLICLVPPREPDYSRLKPRSRYRTCSSSVSSFSSISDSPLEKVVRFDDVTVGQKSGSVSASHDRESGFLTSGLPYAQIEKIREIKEDINWLLQDEIVFSLCHARYITLPMLENVTEHIRKSRELEMTSSRFSSMRLDFVLDAEESLEVFVKELDKVRIGGYKLSKLGNYHYLRLSSSTSSLATDEHAEGELVIVGEESNTTEEKNVENEVFVDFSTLFGDEDQQSYFSEENVSSRHASQMADSFAEMWLILGKTETDVLDVFFHARENHDGEYYYLYTETTNTVKELCHLVNQKLLLRYVHESRSCHPLLQPRSEEDIWNESYPYSTSPHSVLDGRDGSKVVHPEYRFQPGYFKCPLRWTKNFPLHFRLQSNTPRKLVAARAIKALQTVLVKFSLGEKTNMYVYQEKRGDIFYFSLDESLCVNKEVQYNADDCQEESLPSQPLSRSSSFRSLSKTGTLELEEDLDECSRKRSGGVTADKDSASLCESLQAYPLSEQVEPCIVLSVHGVTEPSDEIKKDLVGVLQKHLDDFTLEMLAMSLARNPSTKLALQDVQFMQPNESTPVPFILLVLPPFASRNLHPFSFFFKQHLLHYLTTPRYTTKTEAYHFMKFVKDEGYTQPLPENDVFIFSKPYTHGAKGVACLSVQITDRSGNTLQITPDRKEVGSLNYVHHYNTEEFTRVLPENVCDDLPENATIIKILIWERGDVGLDLLKDRLAKSVCHALCDVLIEYYLLTAPFSHNPGRLFASPYNQEHPKGKMRTSSNPTRSEVHVDCSGGLAKPRAGLTHRRTPSAGLLGCGRSRSPLTTAFAVRPSASVPVSPVRFGLSACGTTKASSTETPEPPTLDFTPIVDEAGENMETSDTRHTGHFVAQSGQTLSCPSAWEKKTRSHSEGSKTTSKHFLPISRSVSNPEPCPSGNKEVPESGRFSPFETFTENELTESKEFGEEALLANSISSSGESSLFSRKTSSESVPKRQSVQEIEMNKVNTEKLKEESMRYENGEEGELHPSFRGPAQELLKFAKDMDTPLVHVQKGTLLTRYSVDAVLFELMNSLKRLCPDLNSKIYRAVPSSQESPASFPSPAQEYVLYDPVRPPLQPTDEAETSVDKAGYMATSAGPPPSFLLISRNMAQWRSNMQKLHDGANVESDSPSISSKEFYRKQQFQSWNWDINDDASERTKGSTTLFSNCSPGFVSRQRLIMIGINDKEVVATTYNLSSDINNQLSARFTRLINWNNARCHLVTCLLQQKMGLFHHSTFQGLNVGKKEINPFCETVNDHHLFSLVKQTAPVSLESQISKIVQLLLEFRRTTLILPQDYGHFLNEVPSEIQKSQKPIPAVGKLLFEETLRDVVPPKPLQATKHCSYRDPVKRHGAQFQEIRGIQILKAKQNAQLQKLFTSWLVDGPFSIITGDKSINLLKRQSRLVHWVKTPFLVSQKWMTCVQRAANMTVSKNTNEPTEQSSEGFGNDRVKEDEWHYKLREEFINYYTQYLQSHGFALVQSAAAEPLKTTKKKSSKPVRKKGVCEQPKKWNGSDSDAALKPLHYYLQKTIDGRNKGGETYAYDGGIMLMELGFQGCHFFVKLYAFHSCRLLGCSVSKQQTKNTFLAECSKVGDLTHLNSFSYDFHLRHVQFLLSGKRLIFPHGFKLTSMLTELMKVYVYPPNFSWNHVCRGQLFLELSRLPRAVVFNYIVECASRYSLTTIVMKGEEEEYEHVLISCVPQNRLYDVSLVAQLHPEVEENLFGLKFFVVMTHRRQLFPKMKAELPCRKQSVGFSGESVQRSRHTMASSSTVNVGSPELDYSCNQLHQSVDDNFKRSSSSPQMATGPVLPPVDRRALPVSESQSEGFFTSSPSTPGGSVCLLGSGTASSSSRSSIATDRGCVMQGLEADPSDSLMSWDMRTLASEAEKCYKNLYATVDTAQKHCVRDHLWHLLLKGTNSDDSDTESNARWSKGLRRKTEYRRTTSDFKESWTVPSSLKDVTDTKCSMSCDDFEYLLDLVKPISLPVVDETLKPFLSMDVGWYMGLWSTLVSRFGNRSREFSKSEGKMHYFVLLNPKNPNIFMIISVHEEKRSCDVKLAHRTVSAQNKESARNMPKSWCDFVEDVVNALCYQMWTGLLLG